MSDNVRSVIRRFHPPFKIKKQSIKVHSNLIDRRLCNLGTCTGISIVDLKVYFYQ